MVYNVTIFGLHLKLNPIAFTLPIGNGWPIYWYGIIIATGFLLAVLYGMKNAERFGINVDKMLDVILVTTPVSIVCARFYYILFDPDRGDGPIKFFSDDGLSGIGIYGAVIGAFACGAVMCKIKKIKIFDMFDLAALAFLIGQGIGRWGNFMNQEAYGTFTKSSWWGMTSNRIALEMGSTDLVHPCFLYESLWCIGGFFLIHFLSKKRRFSGQITLLYCVWYGFERAIVENLRTDSLMIGGFRVSVIVSIIICLGAAITFLVLFKKKRVAIKDGKYVAMFDEETENADEILETVEITEEEQENE